MSNAFGQQQPGAGWCRDCGRSFLRRASHECSCPGLWEEQQREVQRKALDTERRKIVEEKEAAELQARAAQAAEVRQAVAAARAEWEAARAEADQAWAAVAALQKELAATRTKAAKLFRAKRRDLDGLAEKKEAAGQKRARGAGA